MAAVSRFQVVIQKKQMFPALWNSDAREKLSGRGDGSIHYVRHKSRLAVSSIIAPGSEGASNGKKVAVSKKKGSAKTGRGEPVMAFRDQVAVCALASATLESVRHSSPRRGVVLEEASGVASQERELFPAGDPATTLERSRLESQWTLSFSESIDKHILEIKFDTARRGKDDVDQEDLVTSSPSNLGENKAVSSGRPKARLRRLEARQKRLTASEKPTPPEAFALSRSKKTDGRIDSSRKNDGIHDYLSTFMREISKIDRLTSAEEVMLAKIIRAGFLVREERKKLERVVGHELTKAQWATMLGTQVCELDAKLHEAELARDRMVMANLRLVVSVVRQYKSEGIEVADLIQEGSIGLLKGVEKFDHNRGYKLSTYVHWWIRQGVTRAIADHSRTVRLPVHVHDTIGRIRRTKARMLQDGDIPSVEALGEALNLSHNQVKNALKVPRRLKSLDRNIGYQRNTMTDDSETFHSCVADKDSENQPWTMVERASLKEDVENMLNVHLKSRERDILKLHFGVDTKDGFPMSLENISHKYGVSRERVRQLERAAKQKLQTAPLGLDKYCCMLI